MMIKLNLQPVSLLVLSIHLPTEAPKMMTEAAMTRP